MRALIFVALLLSGCASTPHETSKAEVEQMMGMLREAGACQTAHPELGGASKCIAEIK